MWKRGVLLWTVVRRDAQLLWLALRHPLAPRWLKFAALGLALYVISPVDLIPDFIPVIGVVDDLVLVPLAIRFILSRLPAALRAEISRSRSFR